MTILDKIAENAAKYPERIVYCTEIPEGSKNPPFKQSGG